MKKVSFTDPTTIKSQRAYSDALRKTADAPLEGTMAGNVYVAPSWTQGANKMLSAYLSGKSSREADAAEKANSEAKRNAISELLRLPEDQRMQALGNFPSLGNMNESVLTAQLAQSMQPEEAYTIGPGQRRMRGNQLIAEGGPKEEKLVAIYDETSPTGTRMVPQSQATGKPGAKKHPLVQVGGEPTPGAKDTEAWDSLYRETVMSTMQSGMSASDEIANIDRALELLGRVDTGTFEETKLEASKFFKSLGVKVDDAAIADAEELKKFLGDQVMARVAQTKGAVSNKEMELFKQYSANYGNTTEGNRNILMFGKAVLQRNKEQAKLARQLRKEGMSSEQIYAALEQYKDDNSVADILKEIKQAPSGEMSPDDIINAANKILEE